MKDRIISKIFTNYLVNIQTFASIKSSCLWQLGSLDF